MERVAEWVKEPGDTTSRDVKPDFDSGRGYYWMKQVKAARAAEARGEAVHLPMKRRQGLAQESFFEQVDRRLSRTSYTVGVTFDTEGRLQR